MEIVLKNIRFAGWLSLDIFGTFFKNDILVQQRHFWLRLFHRHLVYTDICFWTLHFTIKISPATVSDRLRAAMTDRPCKVTKCHAFFTAP